MKTYAEQIKDLENARAAKAARMGEVMNKSVEEGRSMAADEAEEFDELELDIKQVDEDLVRLAKLEKMNAASARPVEDNSEKVNKSHNRAPAIIPKRHDKDEDFEGQNFTRMVIAKTLGFIDQKDPAAIAVKRWEKTNPRLVEVIKADVAGGGSGSGEWGAELVSQDTWMGDFQEYLYAQTVYNQLNLRQVPANIMIKGQDGTATGYWVGENKPIPVSAADFSDVTLTPLQVAGLAVISRNLVRDSSPDAERLVRDALVNAAAQRIDQTFMSTAAAVSGVSPAGILNGVTATSSAGVDGDGLVNDIKEMMRPFVNNNNSGGLVHVCNPGLASSIGLLRNALGQFEFQGLNENGGMLMGRSVVTGHNVGANVFATLKPSDIYRIGSGGIETSVTDQATIEMSDAPTGASDTPVGQSTKAVSLFQTNDIGIKVVESINFAKRRASAVSYISDADYGGTISV